MGQKKFTDYDAFTEVADGDALLGVDVSDTTQSGAGTTKKLPISVLAAKIREGTTFKEQSTAAGDFVSLADGDKLLGVDVSDSDTAKNLTLSQLAASQAMATSHVKRVTDLTALRAVTGMQANQAVEMVTTGRAGLFRWDSSNLAAQVTADTQMGIYVPPTGQDGSNGAWVRVFDNDALPSSACLRASSSVTFSGNTITQQIDGVSVTTEFSDNGQITITTGNPISKTVTVTFAGDTITEVVS